MVVAAIMIVCAFSSLLQTVFKGLHHPDSAQVCDTSQDCMGEDVVPFYDPQNRERERCTLVCVLDACRMPAYVQHCPPSSQDTGQATNLLESLWKVLEKLNVSPLCGWFQHTQGTAVTWETDLDPSPQALLESSWVMPRVCRLGKDHR